MGTLTAFEEDEAGVGRQCFLQIILSELWCFKRLPGDRMLSSGWTLPSQTPYTLGSRVTRFTSHLFLADEIHRTKKIQKLILKQLFEFSHIWIWRFLSAVEQLVNCSDSSIFRMTRLFSFSFWRPKMCLWCLSWDNANAPTAEQVTPTALKASTGQNYLY